MLLLDMQASRIRKSLANGSSANMKLSKTQLFKIVELREFLFGPQNIFGSPI